HSIARRALGARPTVDGSTAPHLAAGRAAGVILDDLLALALDRAGNLARLHGLSDSVGHRGPGNPSFRDLVAGRPQGRLARAHGGVCDGISCRGGGIPPGPSTTRPVFALAGPAARLERLDARPFPRSPMAVPAALPCVDGSAVPELGRLPA